MVFCYFYKIFNKQSPPYLLHISSILFLCLANHTRYVENVPSFKMRYDFFKNSLFPSTVIEWNKTESIRKSESLNIFEKSILKFMRPSQNRVYNCHNPKRVLLTRLRISLSHFWQHKFKHSFQDTRNPIYNCGECIETSFHYLPFYTIHRLFTRKEETLEYSQLYCSQYF